MTGITKLEASILWGNGFKLKDKEGFEYSIINPIGDEKLKLWNSSLRIKFDIHISEIGIDYFIICHSLDKLTQPIMHEGKEIVPLFELAKIAYPDLKFSDINQDLKVLQGQPLDFYFNEKSKSFHSFSTHSPGHVPNQPALFACMDSLHFDRFNWQERGLTTPK